MVHYADPEAPDKPVCRILNCPTPQGPLVVSGEAKATCYDCLHIEKNWPGRLMSKDQHDVVAKKVARIEW